jgi:hypothetical protein
MVQTRSEETGLAHHKTLQDALKLALKDKTIWKISFDIEDGSRVRLTKQNEEWVLSLFPTIGE